MPAFATLLIVCRLFACLLTDYYLANIKLNKTLELFNFEKALGAASKLGSFAFPASKTSFLQSECSLLIHKRSKKRTLTKLKSKRARLETAPNARRQVDQAACRETAWVVTKAMFFCNNVNFKTLYVSKLS